MDRQVNLQEIMEKLQRVENGMNESVITILKDTIKDSNKHNTKLFIFAIAELAVILITIIASLLIMSKQNQRYEDFLTQFEYADETVYQDVDAGDYSSSIINDGIKIDK